MSERCGTCGTCKWWQSDPSQEQGLCRRVIVSNNATEKRPITITDGTVETHRTFGCVLWEVKSYD